MSDSRIREVVNEPLSAVSFVHDFVELHFDGKIIRAFSEPKVIHKDQSIGSEVPGWRDALCGLIGLEVSGVTLNEGGNSRLVLHFSESAEIEVSLSEAKRNGPEALHYVPGENQPIEVW